MIPHQTKRDINLSALIERNIGKHSPQVNDLLMRLKLQLDAEGNGCRTFSLKSKRMIESALFKALLLVLARHGFDTSYICTVGGMKMTTKPFYGGRGESVKLKDILNENRELIWQSMEYNERVFLLIQGEEWRDWCDSNLSEYVWWNKHKNLLEPALEMISIGIVKTLIEKRIISTNYATS